jgi:hypothetical protein
MNANPSIGGSEAGPAWRRYLAFCFLTICGIRLFLVERFSSAVAYGDDLDGIARRILLPWQNGTLHWSALFAAHNGDHRIFMTRLWEMFWFAVNGSWDPRLVMLAKVPIFAAAMTIFVHLLTRSIGPWRWAAAGALTCLVAFPFAFANAIWAFQSQFDFFFLFAALGWLALVNGHAVLALLLAGVSILALGSGPVVAASYVPYFALQLWEKRSSVAKTAACVSGSLAVVALGLLSPTKEAMPHTGTLVEKAAMLLRICAWPFSNLGSIVERLPETEHYVPHRLLTFPNAEHSWVLRAADLLHRHPALVVCFHALCAALVIAPLALLVLAVFRRRVAVAAAAGTLGVAGFAFLMIAATAVARANQVTIAPRFLDHVALAGFASLASALLLLGSSRGGRRWFAAWCAVMAAGYLGTIAVTTVQLSRRAPASALAVLQRYYATQPHDHSAMTEGEAFRRFIISDDPTQFMSELDTPGLERVLPLEVTAPSAPVGQVARIAFALGRWAWLAALTGLAGMIVVSLRSARAAARTERVAPIRLAEV